MGKGIFLILLIFLAIPALSQVDTTRFQVWSEQDPLQWNDYQVDRQRKLLKHGFAVHAVTSYQYFYLPRELHLDSCLNVLTTFRRYSSWVRDTTDLRLLEHERIHFDIAELYARKIRKQFRQLNMNNTLKDAYTLADSLFNAGVHRQDQYDQETFYGRSSTKQQQWKKHINVELRQLNEFSFENTCAGEQSASY